METIDAYLERKHGEIGLLNDCLKNPVRLPRPRSVDEVIKAKFQLAAMLRAEHTLHDWKATETAWSASASPRSGPFVFSYDYQRADLDVSGPSFYELAQGCVSETIYTASGMAAISTLLLASAPVLAKSDILVLPGSYGETLELIGRFVPNLRLVTLSVPLSDTFAPASTPRILLLDSCVAARAFEAVLHCDGSALDLLVFDTTCFAGRSGRIRRVLRWAQRCKVPVVMVRSHNKLDSLGAEYGRLGSAVFVGWSGQGARGSMIALPPRPATRCGSWVARRFRPTFRPLEAAKPIGHSRSGASQPSCATAAMRPGFLRANSIHSRQNYTSPMASTSPCEPAVPSMRPARGKPQRP